MSQSDLFTTPRDFPDKIIRQSLEHPDNLMDFLRVVLPEIAARVDFSRVQRLERDFVSADWRGREADLLFRAPYQMTDGDELEILIEILVEHQSSPDSASSLRTLLYLTSSWEEHWKAWEKSHQRGEPLRLPPVVPIVLYTGHRPWNAPRSTRELVRGPAELVSLSPAFTPVFWELRDQSVESLLEDLGSWLKMLAVVRAGKLQSEEFEQVFTQALRRLETLAEVDRMRWLDLARAVIAWGWHLRPKQELDHLKQVAVTSQNEALDRKEIESMFESGYTATLKKGIDLGRKEGIDLGRVGGLQSSITRLLQMRFGPFSEQLHQRILVIQDASVLDSLFEQAFKVRDLEEFETRIPPVGTTVDVEPTTPSDAESPSSGA